MAKREDDPLSTLAEQLRRPLAGRRLMAWVLFLGLLAAALVWPMVASWRAGQVASASQTSVSTPGAVDRWWNAGPLDASHASIANDCRKCHSEPFARVKDADCQACHASTMAHVPVLESIDSREPRCASCHRDHRGPHALALQNATQSGPACVACHQIPVSSHDGLPIGRASDFATQHPGFALRVADGAGRLQRHRPDAGVPSEPTGLRFPHDIHLAASGIDSPKGTQRLDCGDCHRPDAERRGFKAVSFEADCQGCHSLTLEASLPGRSLPHGDVDGALAMIREFYAYASQAPANPAAPERLRPAQDRPLVANAVGRPGDAVSLARATAIEIFEKTGCAVCHTVVREAESGLAGTTAVDLPRWRIGALAPRHPWMPAANFDHLAHQSSGCSTCHAAAESGRADNVLMPDITTCRDCHAGQSPVVGKVVSDCGSCHSYHPTGDAHHPVSAAGASP